MIHFLKNFLPHLCIALAAAIMFVIYLDSRNPMMEFLIGTPFTVLCAVNLVAAVASAIVHMHGLSKEKNEKSSE